MSDKAKRTKTKIFIEVFVIFVIVSVFAYIFYRFFEYRSVGQKFMKLEFHNLTSETARKLVPTPCARDYEGCLLVCEDRQNLSQCRVCWQKIRECVSEHTGVSLPPIEGGE